MKAGSIKIGKIGWLFSVILVLAGCQTTSPVPKSVALDNASFMGMWTTYRHCEAASDLDTMLLDARKLDRVAHQPVIGMGHDVLLPQVMKRWVSEPANRLAVDPKAMAVACSLHTGQSALSAGEYELADEMFQMVLNYPEGMYPYYVQQARQGLAQLHVEANASDKTALSSSFTALLAATASKN
ncbi:MAG: hypothetical protein M3Z35_13885 [Nitrospirota bacterium]|nr:hypothetical protein [Nitrospirota bacterium]